jgi:hypothetical protein
MVLQVSKFNEFVRTYWPLLLVLVASAGVFARLDERLSTVVTNVSIISAKLNSEIVTKNEFNIYKEGIEFRLRLLEAEVKTLQQKKEESNSHEN